MLNQLRAKRPRCKYLAQIPAKLAAYRTMVGMGELIAVAGATGHCGKEVVRAAHASGLRVRALVRCPERLEEYFRRRYHAPAAT